MKTSMIIGVLLIVLGVVALAYEGITYTTREKVVDILADVLDRRAPSSGSAAPGAREHENDPAD